MIAIAEEQVTVKPRKRPAAKASDRKPASKYKATLLLSFEASQRLSIHAAMMGEDRSALVDRLIKEHLRRFVVSDRAKISDQATEVIIGG
jgi:hypothetical protein